MHNSSQNCAFSIKTLSIIIKNATLSITRRNIKTLDTVVMSVSHKPIMMSIIMINVVILSVVAPIGRKLIVTR
jgi:hypothetical protein